MVLYGFKGIDKPSYAGYTVGMKVIPITRQIALNNIDKYRKLLQKFLINPIICNLAGNAIREELLAVEQDLKQEKLPEAKYLVEPHTAAIEVLAEALAAQHGIK